MSSIIDKCFLKKNEEEMNEPLLHLFSFYQTFQLIIASKLSTLIRSTKGKTRAMHNNPNDVQTEARDRSR